MTRLTPRLILLSILALFILPLALAWMMFTGALSFRSENTRNLGQLVTPTVPLDWSGVAISDSRTTNPPFEGFWVILYTLPSPCGNKCLDLAAGLRQVRLASGQNMGRIKIALLLDPGRPDSLDGQLLNIYPSFLLISSASEDFFRAIRQAGSNNANKGAHPDVYLVDPDGNIMMTYNGDSSPNKLIKDLERLLAWSTLDKRS